jgi:hypothetical protein
LDGFCHEHWNFLFCFPRLAQEEAIAMSMQKLNPIQKKALAMRKGCREELKPIAATDERTQFPSVTYEPSWVMRVEHFKHAVELVVSGQANRVLCAR